MSDEELIARLRENQRYEWQDPIWETRLAAADRIEALIAENAKLHDHIEGVAKDTHKIMVGYEAKLAKNEVRLRKAVEALGESVREFDCPIARAAIAELKGETP